MTAQQIQAMRAMRTVGKPDSAIKVSSTQWILPGRDIVGDGWVLNFPGLVIEPTTTISPAPSPLRTSQSAPMRAPIVTSRAAALPSLSRTKSCAL